MVDQIYTDMNKKKEEQEIDCIDMKKANETKIGNTERRRWAMVA